MKLFCFLLSFICFISFGQSTKEHKYIPYFRTLNSSRLAYQLTKNLKSDSEKVVAIHSWITHSIRFDVARWISFDYSPTPIKKILRKRKAISTDFSNLFHEMCSYAKIQSTIIQGYTKNEYNDYLDKCYLDEQTWNAVKINDKWYLVDACLDAGKIEYYKRTFAGYFIYAFSLGTSDRLVYRPHFSTHPSQKYLLKNGFFFQTDHFPSDPIWQLKNPIDSLQHFEKSDRYYFSKFDTISTNSANDDFDNQRTALLSQTKNEREIQDGFTSFSTNPRNNYRIANSYLLKSTQLQEIINTQISDKEKIKSQFDSVSTWLSKAIKHCDTNSYFIKTQKSEQIANNVKKKTIVTAQNKLLIHSTQNTLKILSSGLKIGLTGKITLKTTLQRNKILKYKIVRNKKYKKSNFGRRTNQADSIALTTRVNLYLDSIQLAKNEVDAKLKKLETLHQLFLKNMEIYKKQSDIQIDTAKALCSLRLKFVDDLDYDIRKMKDSFIVQKLKADSLLLFENKGSIVQNFSFEFNSLKFNFDRLYQYNTLTDIEFCKLKKSISNNSAIDEKHKLFIENFEKDIKEYNSTLRLYKKKFKQIFKLSKTQIETSKAEEHAYLKEQFIEYQMNAIRSSFINKHYKVRLSENKILKSKITKLSKKVEKEKLKIN